MVLISKTRVDNDCNTGLLGNNKKRGELKSTRHSFIEDTMIIIVLKRNSRDRVN
jgi:hypothetical protein